MQRDNLAWEERQDEIMIFILKFWQINFWAVGTVTQNESNAKLKSKLYEKRVLHTTYYIVLYIRCRPVVRGVFKILKELVHYYLRGQNYSFIIGVSFDPLGRKNYSIYIWLKLFFMFT